MFAKRRVTALVGLMVLAGMMVPSSAEAAVDHPRIVLSPPVLTELRQRAQANDPAWTALKQKCDGYLTGTVEWPEGNDYPGGHNIGEGYQGEGYFPAVANLGLCYRVAQDARYGAKGVEVLIRMSAPAGDPHAVDPLRDSGYGIRFFGLGMALGYDWLSGAMSIADKTRVYTALNRWIDAYEADGFGNNHPQGNYFAGYYATKAVAALATEGDDPQAAAKWNDFLTRVHGQVVQPYYAANLEGGGWPEGQNYGPLATFNMILPVLAAKTAKGIDLVNATAPYRFPSGAASWYLYNVWPSLKRVDDRGTMRVQGEPAPASVRFVTQLAGMLPTWNDPLAPAFHRFARDVRAANPGATPVEGLWSEFLFWNPSAPEADYKTRPLASAAKGMEMASVRSSWDTSAVWGSLNAGPYTNNPDSGEQLFDAGSLAIARGNTPFLVNATGQLFRGTSAPDTFVYNDNFGSAATRGLYNVFYTNTPTPTGQAARLRSAGARTKLDAFDASTSYVFARARYLEDMYPRSGTKTISSWTRDVTYLRPNLFVVYDRTTTTSASVGQWTRFHFAGAPSRANDPSPGVARYLVGTTGSVNVLLPAGHTEQVTPTVFAGSDVSRLDVRPGTAAAENRWLTVFDATTGADAAVTSRLSAADGNVLQGAVTGAVMRSSAGNFAVVSGTGAVGTAVTPPIRYRVPAVGMTHVATDLAPNTTYAVASANDAGGKLVTITAGTGPRTSAAGVLTFTTAP